MTIIKIKGGLGNQLFQYAFGRYLATQGNTEVKIDNGLNTNKQDTYRQYGLNNFKVVLNLASEEEVLATKYPRGIISKLQRGFNSKILRRYNIGYIPGMLETRNKYLEGFWQSHLYLDPIRDNLLQEICPKEPLSTKAQELIKNIEEVESVSVHIRRGDYVKDPKTARAHLAFGMEYYEFALSCINKKLTNPNFFVFSDDIEWVKQNLVLPNAIYVSQFKLKDFEELVLMSTCKHNIIANSSFSFWGAWLNRNPDKIVIAPKKWNNEHQEEYKDLLPPSWLQI